MPTAPAGPAGQPPGATDGIPVGDPSTPITRIRVSPRIPDQPSATAAATATRRYFGSHPWTAISNAATAASKCTGLTAAELRAMAVSPIFKESGGATTPSSAPSPMTLSRYDEWTGVRDGNSNANANYGLYAFRDPYTAYKRAYWTPGIGIWQYDSAGVGAPFTAAERMDVGVISVDVVSGMRDRWCSPGQWVDAPYTEAKRRAAAWAPWWYTDNGGCPLCEQAYQDMAPGTSRAFANISTVPMDAAGGAQKRTCRLSGIAGTLPCTYVDPAKAQGASWWAAVTPLEGGSPTDAPAPLSAPFYDIKIGGQERRYWLHVDTGYAVDISGTRTLGKNARPKNNQSGSGITWSSGGVLCDVTGRRGSCDPSIPPAGVSSTRLRVDGSGLTVRSLDANGDGRGDLLFYRSAVGTADLWTATTTPGRFTTRTLSLLPGAQLVIADIDGDGGDDVVTYRSSTEQVKVVRLKAGVSLVRRMGSHRSMFAFDSDGDKRQELFFYAPGKTSDMFWKWTGSTFVATLRGMDASFQPLVGDFNGDGRDDIFWYGAGPSVDVIHFSRAGSRYSVKSIKVNGRYRPAVGDFDGDGRDDILWYGTGSVPDSVWFGTAADSFATRALSIGGDYRPLIVDLPSDGRDDVVWFGPGRAADRWTRWTAARVSTTSVADLGGTQQPVAGEFGSSGRDGIFWYGSGTAADWLWR